MGKLSKVAKVSVERKDNLNNISVNSKESIHKCFGTNENEFCETELMSLSSLHNVSDDSPEFIQKKLNANLQIMEQFKPKDCIESMSLSHLIYTHELIKESALKANLKDQSTHGRDVNINRLTKLIRAFNDTLNTLGKFQRGGQQKVTVQHIQVSDNSNAIIGDISKESNK